MANQTASIFINASVGTTPADVLTLSKPAYTVQFKNTGDTNNLLVNVLGPHDAGEFDTLEPGDSQEYSNDAGQLLVCTVKAGSATTSYTGSITRVREA